MAASFRLFVFSIKCAVGSVGRGGLRADVVPVLETEEEGRTARVPGQRRHEGGRGSAVHGESAVTTGAVNNGSMCAGWAGTWPGAGARARDGTGATRATRAVEDTSINEGGDWGGGGATGAVDNGSNMWAGWAGTWAGAGTGATAGARTGATGVIRAVEDTSAHEGGDWG